MFKNFGLIAAVFILVSSCGGGNKKVEEQATLSGLYPSKFVTTIDEKPTQLYVMKNANGMEVCVTNIGGRIVSVMVPDKNGNMQDVVLGFDNIKDMNPSIPTLELSLVVMPIVLPRVNLRFATI